jgi:hypothetical protein
MRTLGNLENDLQLSIKNLIDAYDRNVTGEILGHAADFAHLSGRLLSIILVKESAKNFSELLGG